MTLITVSQIQDGVTGVNAASVNGPVNTIVNDYNGNVTDANISSSAAIAPTKIAGGNAGMFGVWTSYSASYTGFSASPTSVNVYSLMGKMCTVMVYPTGNGTSNANTFTITLPFTSTNAHGTFITYGYTKFVNNSGTGGVPGSIQVANNSAIANLYQDNTNAVWATSGAKSAAFTFTYEIA